MTYEDTQLYTVWQSQADLISTYLHDFRTDYPSHTRPPWVHRRMERLERYLEASKAQLLRGQLRTHTVQMPRGRAEAA